MSSRVNTNERAVSGGAGTRPLAAALTETAKRWADSQHQLVTLAAEFADSNEWVLESPTAAHWLARRPAYVGHDISFDVVLLAPWSRPRHLPAAFGV